MFFVFSGVLISSRQRGAKFGKKALVKSIQYFKTLDFLRTALDAGKKLSCSYNKLIYKPVDDQNMQSPAGDATTNICNGVMTIQVGTTVSDGDSSMKNAVTSKINQFFGKAPNQIADYVIYCLPPNTTSGIAYVYQLVALDLLGPLVQLSISIHA